MEYTDEEITAAFMEGDCWALALHMSKATGLDVYVMGEPEALDGASEAERFDWHHAFLLDLDTRTCYDVEGVSTLDEMYEIFAWDDTATVVLAHPDHFNMNTRQYDVPLTEGERLMCARILESGATFPLLRAA